MCRPISQTRPACTQTAATGSSPARLSTRWGHLPPTTRFGRSTSPTPRCYSSGPASDPALFNGFFLSIISGPAILTAVNDVSSVFSPISINVVGGNVLQLNYQGLRTPAFSTSIIDITTGAAAVPELATWIPVFGGYVAGILVTRRVRRLDVARAAYDRGRQQPFPR